MSLSPPSRTFTAPVSPAKPSALQVIPPTRHIASSVCCHQGGDCGVSRRGPADWRTASFIRLSGSSTLSRLPPPLLSFTPRTTEPWHYDPPPAPHIPRTFHPPTYKLWPAPVTLCSIGLITTSFSIDCKLPLSDSLIKDCSLSSYHVNRLISSFALHIISAQFCLFNWFALYLPCALCHFIYLFFFSFFSTMSSFVYLYSLYVHMFKLYLSVFVRLLSVFNVNCMHQGSESYAISILCMYVLYMWQNWQ